MKVVVAALRHETNTFSPVSTPLSAFISRYDKKMSDNAVLLSGQQAVTLFEHTQTPFAAFLKAAKAQQATISVPLYANAHPSAPTDSAAFDAMCTAIVEAIDDSCDAVLLDLHGAMVADGVDDAEGELITRIRSVAPTVPVAVALDFHANLSDAFFTGVDVVTGYCTYPHIDTFETGERAARTLFDWINGGEKPVLSYQRLPMLTHMNNQTPAREPMKSVMDRAIEAEASGEVLNASVFGGFPLADVPNAAVLCVVVAREKTRADAVAKELATLAWERRAAFVYHPEPLADTVATAKALTEFPVVIADHGNNCGAGGSADNMAVLEEVINQRLTGVIAGPVCDPQVVGECIAAGVGADITVDVGGKTDMPSIGLRGVPLTLSGRVRRITDGRFTVTGPMFTGVQLDLGRTVLIEVTLEYDSLQLVVSEDRVEPYDLGVFTHCGVDPTAANYILLQSRQHFKAGFEPVAKHILLAAGPGVCTSDYDSLPFTKLTRPIYPLDDDARWP